MRGEWSGGLALQPIGGRQALRAPGHSLSLSASSLEPVIFWMNLQRYARRRMHCCESIEAYEKLEWRTRQRPRTFSGKRRSSNGHYTGHASGVGTTRNEQSGVPRFHLSSRPSARFHGTWWACVGDVKSQLASGGTVFLTAASTGELERYADICREYEVRTYWAIGKCSGGFHAEGALESAGWF